MTFCASGRGGHGFPYSYYEMTMVNDSFKERRNFRHKNPNFRLFAKLSHSNAPPGIRKSLRAPISGRACLSDY